MNCEYLRNLCPFCLGNPSFVYMMDDYRIEKCTNCNTGFTNPMPSDEVLKEYYNGFLYSADMKNMPNILKSSKKLYQMLKFEPGMKLRMLDVGGGGGFYSRAFEELGYGNSTYIDLDQKSCEFAQNNLKISTVINDDVTTFINAYKFDFIICRHVIEHLIRPDEFILNMVSLLSDNGVLLLMCPNGESLEYLAYPNKGLKSRFSKIKNANHISSHLLLSRLIFGDMLHGIDPPRHLWAISMKGLEIFLRRNSINYEIYTKKLSDVCYSPYFTPYTFSDKVSVFLANKFFSKIRGGTHLVVEIRN